MSSIPTIFNSPVIPHTVIGQPSFQSGKHGLKISLVLLNRGARVFREDTLRELTAQGWSEVISLEEPSNTADYEELTQKHKNLKFLLMSQIVTPGEQINLGIQEAKGDLVLVMWNDMTIPDSSFYPKSLKAWSESAILCSVPEIKNREGEEIPTVSVPSLQGRKLKIINLGSEGDNPLTLCPYDYVGLYDRMKFLTTGGYDPKIPNTFWQRVDFGMRAFLWGEKIALNRGFKVQYLRDLPLENRTVDSSYRSFYLKNLLLTYDGNGGVLRKGRLFPYLFSSGLSFLKSYRTFQETRTWVETHKYRFRTDARHLVETWGSLR